MYDHTKQYRCTIIRGKTQSEMDDLLPAYAKIIDEICPCSAEEFESSFNNSIMQFLPASAHTKKTLDNHRTEIAGKLFGMYYFSHDGMVYESDRTKKYLSDNDQPAFFKDICYKMQFPNGMQKIHTVLERIEAGINVRPNAYVLKTLQYAKNAGIVLTKKDIGYYILNSLDVLQGKANPLEIVEAIQRDKDVGIERRIEVPGKASSYNYQHINEQINYLELANLVITNSGGEVLLNPREMDTITLIANQWDKKPDFDVYSHDLSNVEARKEFQIQWDYYYSLLSDKANEFETSVESLRAVDDDEIKKPSINLTELGDEGEIYVYEYEKRRVSAFNARLANKVVHLGKTRGLGYDIQSVIAEPGEFAEFVKYIEVKSTKRVTLPDINDNLWVDTLNITRNEWVAAQQHQSFYSIYRVYFVRGSTVMFVISNVAEKYKDGKLQVVPITYRIDFSSSAVDKVISI